MATSRSTGSAFPTANRGVRTLCRGAAGMEDRASVIDPRVDAGEALALGETREIPAMFLHPVAEALPERAGFRLRHRHAVDVDRKAGAHDRTSASTSAACLVTSTER